MKVYCFIAGLLVLSFAQAGLAAQDECEFIRKSIKALPAAGGKIVIPEGIYNCAAPVVLDRDNVTLEGANKSKTVLRLQDQVHAPLLIIGSAETYKNDKGQYVTTHRVKNIKVANLTLDGNLANHDSAKECGEGICEGNPHAVRNNGITIRGASHIVVENVVAHSMISGGMVTEKYCDNLKVNGFESYGNFFDGFAGYETTDSVFNNLYLHDNHEAGISIDINFNDNTFHNTRIIDNRDVGIFGRFIAGNRYINMDIVNSGSFGIFFANSGSPNTCAINNDFINLNIRGSAKAAFRNNDDCGGNRIYGKSSLCGNKENGVSESRAKSVVVSKSTLCGQK